jgi:urease accessory protein
MAAAPAYGLEAALRLRFETGGDATVLASCEQQPPWRVIRAFTQESGQALVHLHNMSGGVLGGDRLSLDIQVGARAKAQITSTGATRLYRSREGSLPSRQFTRITVDEEAVAEYLPDPLIPYEGAEHQQSTQIELGRGACLFWWETLTPGRYASGEAFRY